MFYMVHPFLRVKNVTKMYMFSSIILLHYIMLTAEDTVFQVLSLSTENFS